MTARIPIADDEPNMLRVLGYTLHTEGYKVVTAATSLVEIADRLGAERIVPMNV